MVKSIQDLRVICQRNVKGKDIWSWYQIQRNISIRFTRVFVSLNLSANKIQLSSLFLAFGGAFHLFLGNYWFAFVLYQLHFIFDCCDGELARYYGTVSWRGLFQDRIVHMLTEPLLFVSLALGMKRLDLAVLPALCCENGLRLIKWGYNNSQIEESNELNFESEKIPQTLIERVARFFAIYGFIWLIPITSFFGKEWLCYLLLVWNIWTPLACLYVSFSLLSYFWRDDE